MKAQVYSPTGRLGKVRLERELGPFVRKHGLRIGQAQGAAVVRSGYGRRYAEDIRAEWHALTQIVDLFGFPLMVETTAREARALLSAGFVSTGAGLYRLVIRDRRVAVESAR